MTKKQMVAAIQVAEAKAWKQFRVAKHQYGEDDVVTNRRRAQWSALDMLRNTMGIESMGVESLIKQDLLAVY